MGITEQQSKFDSSLAWPARRLLQAVPAKLPNHGSANVDLLRPLGLIGSEPSAVKPAELELEHTRRLA